MVRRIFSLTLEGYGPYQIACKLSTDRIEIPVVHLARFQRGCEPFKAGQRPLWVGSSTIVNILKKREYLGHTINFKTRKHFKDKKSHYVSEDKWTIFENTHEAIIDQQTLIWRRKSAAMYGVIQTAGAKRLPSQVCSIVPIVAARCMSTAPTMASGFSIYLFQLYQSSVWDTMPYTTPYQ